MPRFFHAIPRVLVMLQPALPKVRSEKLQGILRYARLHGPWDVQVMEDRTFTSELGTFKNWRPDGIITRSDPHTLDALFTGARQIPAVFIDSDPKTTIRRMSVHHDLKQDGEAAADYYLRQGLAHFAFVGSVQPAYWATARAAAFAGRLRQNGHDCTIYKPRNVKDWGLEQRHLRDWLKALPKPCGLFVAFDLRAKGVLDTCLAAGICVPEEIAVISVDNDETICENTLPTLSSVQPDFDAGGFMAAERLDQMMRGKKRKAVCLTYGVKRIVHRQSSQFIPMTNRLAAAAVEFIRLNACEGITVPDVARHLHVSRRFAEIRFKAAVGHSILDEIQTRRLEKLCILLRETTLSIGEIGERCGYDTEAYLKRLFKKRFGLTMRAHRQSGIRERPESDSGHGRAGRGMRLHARLDAQTRVPPVRAGPADRPPVIGR